MKTSVSAIVFGLVAAIVPFSAFAMSNKDVIKMWKAGLGEDTIIAAMQKESAEYDTGADALIELKSAGVSDRVIQRMIVMQSGGSAPSAPNGGTPAPAPGSGPFYGDFPSIAPPLSMFIQPIGPRDWLGGSSGKLSDSNDSDVAAYTAL
jgi:hypothetical protein